MLLGKYGRSLLPSFARRDRRRLRQRSLLLEPLEARTVPTVLWSSTGTRTVVDGGGPVLTHVDVDLIFWGTGWNNAQALMSKVTSSMQTLMDSPFLSGLAQYRGIGQGQLLRTDLITSTSPAAHTTDLQYDNFVKANLNNHTLSVTPNMDTQILYMVVPPPGTTDPSEGAAGAHGTDTSTVGRFSYAWTENINSLDDVTDTLSHELIEGVTDPQPGFHYGFWVPSTRDELCDGEAENYNYRMDGVLVQSSLSQKDHAYVVIDGNTQSLSLSRTLALTFNGDQLSTPDDTITIDQENSGYKITINDEVFQFEAVDYFTGKAPVSAITINTGNGNDVVNLERTISTRPVTINLGNGTDTVNLSPTAQNLANVAGAVTVNGGSGTDTLNLYDQGVKSNQNYTVTSSSLTRNGLGTLTYKNLATVVLTTTNGNDTVTVQTTAANTAVTITGGSGNNTLVDATGDTSWTISGSNSGTLSGGMLPGLVSFSGIANLSGGTGSNTFGFSDGGSLSGSLKGGKVGTLDYSATSGDVSINLASSTATGLGGSFSSIQSLTGGSGSNTLTGPNSATVWQLSGQGSGTVNGTLSFTGFENLLGGLGTNSFVFSDGAGVAGNLDGGGGGTLDYTAYSSSVVVDLQTGAATGVGGTLANIQTVLGGTGGGAGSYNILVGNGGNTLTGGTGRRNLLIAGASASTLIGGNDEDLLIGGTTAYDMDVATLMAIMDYWSGSSDDFATRVANLTSGNGVPLLDATVVTGNGGNNVLTGNGALALLYTDGQDPITGFDPNAQQVVIGP